MERAERERERERDLNVYPERRRYTFISREEERMRDLPYCDSAAGCWE